MKRFKKFGKRFLVIALVALSLFAVALPAMAAGHNSGVSLSDIRSNTGKYWKNDTSTTKTEIATVQQKLKDAGYLTGSADGIYGPATESAVKKLQKANGLTQDGLYGYASDKALFGGGGTTNPGGSSEINRDVMYKGLITASDYLRIRSAPDLNATEVARASAGATVDYYKLINNNDWVYMKGSNGIWGYASASYVRQIDSYSMNLNAGETRVATGTCSNLGLYVHNIESNKTIYVRVRFVKGIETQNQSVTLYGSQTGYNSSKLFTPPTGYTNFEVFIEPQVPGTHQFRIEVRRP